MRNFFFPFHPQSRSISRKETDKGKKLQHLTLRLIYQFIWAINKIKRDSYLKL